MATTIKVECQGPTGTTTATAAKRAIDATASGVLTSVTVTEDANHDGLFVATLTYDESDPANEPLGSWAVVVGGTINTLTMTASDNLVGYKSELPNVPSAVENAEATRTELAAELARIDENVSAAKELTSDYDAAKTAATQASVTALPQYGDEQKRTKSSASSSELIETVTKVEE